MSHPYFANSHFENTKKKYENIKLYINEKYSEIVQKIPETSYSQIKEPLASTSSPAKHKEENTSVRLQESRGLYSKLDEMYYVNNLLILKLFRGL